MFNKNTQFKRAVIYSIFPLTLSACGGGGDDGGAAGFDYTGETSQASLTLNNGEEVSATAYQNGDSGVGAGTVLASLNEPTQTPQRLRPATSSIAKSLASAISKVPLSQDSANSSRATQTESDSITGDCGGSASYTISIDDITGDFSGNLNFANYCELDEYMNGNASFVGNINLSSETFNDITMTTSSLTIRAGADSYTMSGNMSFNPSNNPIVVNMDIKLKDNSTEQVFLMENFNLSVLETSYEELSMEGRFYHPDHGYADVTTPMAFRFTGSNLYPYPGVMVATGTNNSTTTLTSLSTTSYQLDIDENGDGNPDQTTTGNWSEL